MKNNWIQVCLTMMVLILGAAPYLGAQELYQDTTIEDETIAAVYENSADSGRKTLGLQASTNFEDAMVGLKIHATDSLAITPKVGFYVQSWETDNVDTAFNFGFGSGIDYYFKEGPLRPYVGGDILIYIFSADDTDWWMTLAPHVGAEYWLTENFSAGGNLGVQLGFGESSYIPGTVGYVGNVKGNFGFGIAAKLHVTYYF